MIPLRISVATLGFAQPLKTALQSAAELGVAGVQLDVRSELKPSELSATGRRQFLHYLGELGLSVAALNFPARRTFFDPNQLDLRIDAVKNTLQFAHELNCSVVTCRVGRIPERPESPEFQLLRETLDDLAAHGNRVGATFCVTPTHDSPETLLRFLDAIKAGPIGINFDPANFVMTGIDPMEAMRALHERIFHMRVRDALRDVDGTGLEVPVGRGEVEWDEFLALTEEARYRGWLTIDRTTGDDKLGDCRRAVQYLRQVAAG